jgi:tRNA nucleotidyltransferase (CCA-adding enzyme)
MTEAFDDVVETVRSRVEPDDAERAAVAEAVETLTERAEAALAERGVAGEVIQVGSTARDTWLAGERDIDIFVCVPPALDREDLESLGLEIGHEVLPDGHEEYAEHPYVVGEYEGFVVDVVPCYAVDDPSQIQSAVDRTPFHNRYVAERLTPGLASDVRVCKQFLSAIGAYGSDLRTKGFSGFLTELLVIEYGGFEGLVTAAADWSPPVHFDPESHGTETFDDLLVVIDPTDPARNVAAVCSQANVARLQHFSRELFADPRIDLFEVPTAASLEADEIRKRFAARGTTPIALAFETPDIVDDQLWPQLERSLHGIADELDRRGFDVFRAEAFGRPERCVLLFELAVAERPPIERHAGPPVHVRDHAESFYEAYEEDGDAVGPFIEEDRYVVERPREVTSAEAFLDSHALFEVGLGAHVESTLEQGYELLVGEEIANLAANFGTEFAVYLEPTPRGRQ